MNIFNVYFEMMKSVFEIITRVDTDSDINTHK